ncbi:hypothetical protein NDU88_004582 [Pleurodeles waltl]|uniref:Uncharacterized protein n=1 Tax=Pleurodeles waltl TaxID=8319 RepID=A0AAV7M6Q1_PLEWA|nr:hypothetical protein NDU88_004582 [Pleurodeles waltl]
MRALHLFLQLGETYNIRLLIFQHHYCAVIGPRRPLGPLPDVLLSQFPFSDSGRRVGLRRRTSRSSFAYLGYKQCSVLCK